MNNSLYRDMSLPSEATNILDPRCLSPLDRSRQKKKKMLLKSKSKEREDTIIEPQVRHFITKRFIRICHSVIKGMLADQ